jgi:CRP/FNR family transcriptional regulator, cyclic AMP receptor protein
VVNPHGTHGFEPSESCQAYELQTSAFFSQLSPAALKDFNAVGSAATYPHGAVLFLEKQDPSGVFVLCAGEVKLTISSSAGKTLIVRIAKAGEILGLTAVLSGRSYEVTAETLHPCQVAFVRREEFLRLLSKHPEMHEGVLKQLTTLYSGACEQLRTVGLCASAPEKVARLLLDWSADRQQVKVPLTHEEIAAFVGTTRETVTRTLSDFKTRNLVRVQGSTLTIANRRALEAVGGFC